MFTEQVLKNSVVNYFLHDNMELGLEMLLTWPTYGLSHSFIETF